MKLRKNYLKLRYNGFAEAIRLNKVLIELDLEENNLDSKDFKELGLGMKLNHNLSILNLDYNKFGNENLHFFLTSLNISNSLQTLSLKENEIDDAGAFHFGKFLCENRSLQELNLESNQITEKGLPFISRSLIENKTLHVLLLAGNASSYSCSECFLDDLQTNISLTRLSLTSDSKRTQSIIDKINEILETNNQNLETHIAQQNKIDLRKKKMKALMEKRISAKNLKHQQAFIPEAITGTKVEHDSAMPSLPSNKKLYGSLVLSDTD